MIEKPNLPQNSIVRKVYYIIELDSSTFHFLISLVNTALITIMSLLSIEKISTSTEIRGVSSFFISIIIILLAVVISRWWGVLSTFLGSFLYGLGLKYGILDSFLWSMANGIQAILLLFIFKHKEIENVFSLENLNLSKSFLKISFWMTPLLMIATCFFDGLIYLLIFFIALVLINIFYAIQKKYWKILILISLFLEQA